LLGFGLSNFQINFINAVFFHLVVFGLDFPTGIFGDLFGKKLASVIGFFAYSMAIVVYAFGNSFWYFALAEFLLAVGTSFISGSFLAWMVEHVGKEKFAEIEGRSEFWVSIFSFIAVSLSGIVSYWYGFQFVLWIEAIGVSLVGILAIFLMQKDTAHHDQTKSLESAVNNSKKSWQIAVKNKESFALAILNSLSWVGVMAMFIYWQPIFLELGLSQQYTGFLFGFFGIAMGFGSRFVNRIKDTKNLYSKIMFLTAIVVLISALFLRINLFGSIIFFLCFEFLIGAKMILSTKIYNQDLDEKNRASVNSVYSTIEKIGSTLGLLLLGYLADITSRSFTWYFAAGIFGIVAIISFLRSKVS
jgi:predicted MFS family arabinose efflux permease